MPDVAELLEGSAMRLANLPPSTCLEQVRRDKLPFKRCGKVDSIAAPLRFSGELGEVTFQVPPEKTPFGLIDCRLALVLSDITPLLRAHHVRSVRIDSFYRPRARLPAGHGKKSQHAYALAADVVSVTLDDGRELDVERDFHGRLDAPVCGPEAFLEPETDEAVRLRNLVCDMARRGAFHHMLTPNHDHAHRNHLHLDIKRGNKRFSLD